MVRLRHTDFSDLRIVDTEYATRTSIPDVRVKQFLTCAIYYNFDLASVIRYTGGNYTASHLDVDNIVDKLRNLGFDETVLGDLHRSLTVGCPAYFNAESSLKNFNAFLKYGNHSSIIQHFATVAKTMTKECNHSYVIPFPRWIARLCPNLHLTPQGMLVKPEKKPRLIWDGTFIPEWWAISVNDMQRPDSSPNIIFGTAFMRHLIRIWNLRISYPHTDIYLWDDDVAGAYRIPKYHPAVAAAFCFIIMSWLFLPTGGTFGSTTSPPEYEPYARARAFLAEHLSRDDTLVLKHADILRLVQFETEADPSSVVYVQAVADSINKGVFVEGSDTPVNTPHNPYVDDSLFADVQRYMLTAMAASIEALFSLLGYPNERVRRSALSMDKFASALCSWRKEQLGILIDSRSMTISLPPAKIDKLINLLSNTWHPNRRTFTLREGTVLLGSLEHAAQICPWGKYLYSCLRHSVNLCLKQVIQCVKQRRDVQQMISVAKLATSDDEQLMIDRYNQRNIAKKVYDSKLPYFITKELRTELERLRYILASPTDFPWVGHIAHIVPRDHDFVSYGDSSLYAAGGYSLDLRFWWYLEWPKSI